MRLFLLVCLGVLVAPPVASHDRWPDDSGGDSSTNVFSPGVATDWPETAPSTTATALDNLALRQGSSIICEATEAISAGHVVASAGAGSMTASADLVIECSIADATTDSVHIIGVAKEGAASGERLVVITQGFVTAASILATSSPLGGAFTDCDADGEIINSGALVANTNCVGASELAAFRQPWGIWIEDGTDDLVWVMSGETNMSVGFDTSMKAAYDPTHFENALGTMFGAFSAIDTDIGGCMVKLYSAVNPTEAQGTNDFMSVADHKGSTTETNEDDYVVNTFGGNIAKFRCSVDVAPGSGDEWALTVRDGTTGAQSDTALTCTISGTDTTCRDFTNAPALTDGATETLTISVDGSGGASDPAIAGALECSFCIIP